MLIRCTVVLALFAACAAPPVTAPLPPSTPPPIPPPPPHRPIPQAQISGIVREPVGNVPAAHALVSARPCSTPEVVLATVFADDHGQYRMTIDATHHCVLVTATSGGTTATVTSGLDSVADIDLPRLEPLTAADAEALIAQFVDLLNHGLTDELMLSTFVLGGPEALRSAKEDYQAMLGANITATITGSEFTRYNQRVQAALRGSKGTELSLDVYQDRVRRLHSPVVYYSLSSRHFISMFSRLMMSPDPERLARLLTADDVDYPVEKARRLIERIAPSFQVTGGAFQLTGVEESRNRMTYRVTWRGANGEEKSMDVVLGYGDGLLYLVEDAMPSAALPFRGLLR